MAPKRHLPPQTNSSDSDSEDQQHSSSSDDSDSEPQQLTQSKPHQLSSQSESDAKSDSDPGSDSDSDSDASSDKTHKTPCVVSPQPKKPTSKSTQLKANGKRPAEPEVIEKASKSNKSKSEVIEKASKSKSVQKVDESSKSDDKSGKKSKVSNGDEEGAEIEDKKSGFPRVFSEKDAIVLLQGIIDFKQKKGIDPSLNMVAFQESVEDLLSCSVTKSQIADKIRRLKKKYIMNSLKKGQNGEDPVFSRPLDYQSFQLSKKIWASEFGGSEVDGGSKVKSSSKKKDGNVASKTSDGKKEGDFEEEVMDKAEVEMEDCWSLYPCLCNSLESEAKNNFKGPISLKKYVRKVVSGLKEKARELEQDWKDFHAMEQQTYAKRIAVISKQAEAAMNVIQP